MCYYFNIFFFIKISTNSITSDSCGNAIIKSELISEDEMQSEEKVNNLDTKEEISEEKIMLGM